MKTKKYIQSFAIGLIKYTATGFIVAFGILAFSDKEKNANKPSGKMKIVPVEIKMEKTKEPTLQAISFIKK